MSELLPSPTKVKYVYRQCTAIFRGPKKGSFFIECTQNVVMIESPPQVIAGCDNVTTADDKRLIDVKNIFNIPSVEHHILYSRFYTECKCRIRHHHRYMSNHHTL